MGIAQFNFPIFKVSLLQRLRADEDRQVTQSSGMASLVQMEKLVDAVEVHAILTAGKGHSTEWWAHLQKAVAS